MKKRKEEFSLSEEKDFSNTNENKSRFEYLYENSYIHLKKLDLMRAKKYYIDQKKKIPIISKKAQEINRPKELFFKRLYDPNTYIKDKNKKSQLSKNENEKIYINNENKTNKENDNESMKSSLDISSKKINEQKEIKDDNNDDEESLYMINDKKKNEEYKKLYKSKNNKNKSFSFLFKPIINDNSKTIAKRIKTTSKERLMTLSITQKNNLKSILRSREIKKEKQLKEETEKKLFKINNNTYRPYVKDNKRKWVDRLYEKGMNSIKKKEEIIRNERLKLENEYLKYSFSPILNHNYSYTNFTKTKNSSINSSSATNGKNLNLNLKNKESLSDFKTKVYERNKNWKNLIEKKNNKLKEEIKYNSMNNNNCYFSPILNDNVMETDISFIGKNIIEYESFLDKYNYKKYKKSLDKVNYRKINIPPKRIYPKKLVVEFISEYDSNMQTNSGTIKITYDKRPINEIHKNRKKLKINDFFEGDIKLQSNMFFKGNILESKQNRNKDFNFDKNENIEKDKINFYGKEKKINKNNDDKNDLQYLSFFNAVNNIINNIE